MNSSAARGLNIGERASVFLREPDRVQVFPFRAKEGFFFSLTDTAPASAVVGRAAALIWYRRGYASTP
jgi:hypothetical protein